MTDSNKKIVVLDGYTLNPGDLSWDELEGLGTLTVHDRTTKEEVVSRMADAEIVLTNKTPINASTLEQLPALKCIGVMATGFNVVDVEVAKQRGVIVTNIPSYSTHSVAQLAIAHLLHFCHQTGHHDNAVKMGRWASATDFCFWDTPQMELMGKTMGIVGFGQIGHQLGRVASALGMSVKANANTPRQIDDIPGIEWVDLDTLLRTSDVISLNCPETPKTRGIINRENLEKMKTSAFLINLSRGGLVVEQDLADALNAGKIAGAGIDVLSVEPPQETNPLLSAKNVSFTPHIAWATIEARQRLMSQTIDNVKAYLDGQPTNVVNA